MSDPEEGDEESGLDQAVVLCAICEDWFLSASSIAIRSVLHAQSQQGPQRKNDAALRPQGTGSTERRHFSWWLSNVKLRGQALAAVHRYPPRKGKALRSSSTARGTAQTSMTSTARTTRASMTPMHSATKTRMKRPKA